MTSIQDLIGLSHQGDTHASTSKLHGAYLATDDRIDPDDYPSFAEQARQLGTDIREAYSDALESAESHERIQDIYFLNRAKEFVELDEQIQTSTGLLRDLSSFLSTFQTDLSAVSGHISELQGRSRTIEQRLELRKAVERSLHPYLDSIAISPALIKAITEANEVDAAYVSAVTELDSKLGAIRSGPRVDGRRTLDSVAEALRLKATAKILSHLMGLLKPYTTSVALPLDALQDVLLPLKPLFDFLRRHSARQAHDFQKAYSQTLRWYYETAFRRYVRGLESVRVKNVSKSDLIGAVGAHDGSLALLKRSNGLSSPSKSRAGAASQEIDLALQAARVNGPVVTAFAITANKQLKPPAETLFRSISLVFADNAQTEYDFITAFFGMHSTLLVPEARTPSLFSPSPATTSRTSSRAPSESGRESTIDGLDKEDRATVAPGAAESVAGKTTVTETTAAALAAERNDKMVKAVVDGLWKNIMEPAQEYVLNFIAALLAPAHAMGPLALLAMIRLNETLFRDLVLGNAAPGQDSATVTSATASSEPKCPPIDSHLITVRMQLYPTFSQSMTAQIDSLKRINGSLPSGARGGGGGGGVGGFFSASSNGNGGLDVKDSVVSVIVQRYADLFDAFLKLSDEADEELIFSSSCIDSLLRFPNLGKHYSLLRLRDQVDKLLSYQASKISDQAKQRGFLLAHYEELLRSLSNGLSSHSRCQAEVAHWREQSRKAGGRSTVTM